VPFDEKLEANMSSTDQFGADKGFTAMSIVKGKQIIYPSYTDAQLSGGKVVAPDQSYAPVSI